MIHSLEVQLQEKSSGESAESGQKVLELMEENEQLAEALKESDVKYQILFAEHSKLVKENLKESYQITKSDQSQKEEEQQPE